MTRSAISVSRGAGAVPVSSDRSSPSSRRMSASAPRPVAAIASRARSAAAGSWRGGVPRAVGLHHHHREAVRHHVVHLAGDPGPLVQRGELDLLGRLALDPLAALDQRVDVRPADPAEGAQRPGGDDDRGEGEEIGHVAPRRPCVAVPLQPPDGRQRRAHERDDERSCRGEGGGVAGDRVERDRQRHLPPQGVVEHEHLDGVGRGDDREDLDGVAATPEERRDLRDREGNPRARVAGQREAEDREQQGAGQHRVEPPPALRTEAPGRSVGVRGGHARNGSRRPDPGTSAHGMTPVRR